MRRNEFRGRRSNGRRLVRAGSMMIGVLALIGCPAVPHAAARAGNAGDQAPATDLTTLSLEELMNIEVVNGASRRDQRVADAPASVTVVTASEIQRFGWRTLTEILASVRGLYSSYDRNYSYIGLRGFLRPGDYNTRILLLVDGHRMNDNVYGGAYVGDEQFIDVELIDRVEVIRGPSSSLYGTSAFLAVVNVITKKTSAEPGTRAQAGVGSYTTQEARVSHSGGLGDAGYTVSGSWFDTPGRQLHFSEFDDPSTHNGAVDNDGDRYTRLFGKLERKDLTIMAAWSSRLKEIPTASFGTIFDDTRARTRDERALLEVRVDHSYGDGARLLTRAYYDRYYYRGDYPYDYPPMTMYTDPSTGVWAGAETLVALKPVANNSVSFGAEYRWNIRQEILGYDRSPYFLYTNVRQESAEVGVYVADDIAVNDKLSLSLGARYDHYETFGSTLNPRVALIHHPAQDTTLKLLYGTAFRAPNVYESFYTDGSAFRPNPRLKPEGIDTWEAVAEKWFGPSFRLEGSIFRFNATDLISLTTDPSSGFFVFRNVSRVRSEGVELEMERRWRRNAFLRLSHAWTTSRDLTARTRLTASPRNLTKLHLGLPLAGERLSAGLEVLFTGHLLTHSGTEAPGHTVANLTLLSRDLAPGLDLTAGVYNLLGSRYGDPGSTEHLQDVILQDGRTLRLGIAWRF